jgi:hypothetical protein
MNDLPLWNLRKEHAGVRNLLFAVGNWLAFVIANKITGGAGKL